MTKEATKTCGMLKGLGPADYTLNLNGVVDFNPAADEASYNEVQALFNQGTKVWAWYTNDDGDIYHYGTGWFTNIGNQNAVNGLSKFSFTFEFDGDIDTSETS